MGLADRKQKQRIPNDPRNLSWADDASRFGLSYLSKFGWDSSQGLGSSGDGIKTHLKVQQKLDMLGVGGQHQRDPNGIAWKQNKDFEALLRRLNTTQQEKGNGEEDGEEQSEKESQMALGGTFMRAQEGEEHENEVETVMKKKRKHGDTEDPDTSETTKKKNKKEKKGKEEKHKKSDADPSTDPSSSSDPISESPTPNASGPTSQSKPKARPMAHRARIRAAKSLATKSAAAISEILGIAPSTSTSTSTTTTQTSTSTPAPSYSSTPAPTPQPALGLDNLTTSTKSVADYFKEKLARTSSSSFPTSLPATPGLGAFRRGLGSSDPSGTGTPAYEDEQPRKGIGSRAPAFTSAAPPPRCGRS